MVDCRSELAALVAAYDEHGGKWPQHHEEALWQAVEHVRAVLNEPAAIEFWHIPRALSDDALRLLTTLPMEEIERRLREPVADSVPVARLTENVQVIEPANGSILVPVPSPITVDERLPGPADFDEQGRCWFYSSAYSVLYAYWVLREPDSLRGWETHWLPAHALPLPEFE